MHISSNLSVADVCAENDYLVILRFQEPQTVEEVMPLLDPLHATLACEDPIAQAGQPAKLCYIIKLGSDLCCSDADRYFATLTMPVVSTDVPHPETPCSCETHWTNFRAAPLKREAAGGQPDRSW